MLVITQHAEHRLLNDLKNSLRHAPARKCFSLELSKAGSPRSAVLETVLRVLDDTPNSYMAQVYICADMDIFILIQGFMQRHFQDFVAVLSQELGIPDLDRYTQIYEIGLHWRTLENLCSQKLDAIDNDLLQAQTALRREENRRKTDAILEGLDIEAISTLARRRADNPEARILIADDDQLTRALAGNALGPPLQTHFAHNGKETLRHYIRLAPDVLFLDIGLPDINGHLVLESLMHIDPDAYIIMLSGRRDKANIVRALESGAQGFIGKPFTRIKLFEYVHKSPFVTSKRMLEATGNAMPDMRE